VKRCILLVVFCENFTHRYGVSVKDATFKVHALSSTERSAPDLRAQRAAKWAEKWIF